MKPVITLLFLLAPFISVGQRSFARVDQHAATLGYYPLDQLAEKLTAPFYNDSEKVRAIFYWITTHITYDVNEFHSNNVMIQAELETDDSAEVDAYFNDRIANEALAKKMGICAGYASLFKVLCDRAKIPCIVIPGYAKITLSDINKPFNENHAWNAVKLNGNWVLIDACWASGYCDDEVTKFTRQQNEFFYMTPPWLFIYNHYPTDSKWTLINSPMTKVQYADAPHWMLCKKNIIKASFTPQNGVLNAKIGDTLKIAVELCESDSAGVQRDLAMDELGMGGNPIDHEQPIKPQQQMLNNIKKKIVYSYVVWSKAVDEVEMLYGKDYLIAYKLRVQ